ncbi:MAG: hypothetical protein ACQCN4_02100 [Candidatus Bathyarchaeia archaeon]|jgi:hypothetical protein
MPLVSFLGEMLKSGKVTVSTNNVEAIEIKAMDKKISINALSKEVVKDTISAARGAGKEKGILNRIQAAQESLGMLKDVAEELSDAGLTVTFSYKDKVLVTLGSEADPKLSSVVTGTKAIEVNSLRKLAELVI